MSLPRAESSTSSGTSFSSLRVALVSSGISGFPGSDFPRCARMVLQQVSISSLAVPMA